MDKNINEIFPLGEDKRCHISTDCTKTGLNNNIMVVGGSGSGKTTSVMMPIICNLEDSNAVVVHTKRGIYDKTKKLLEEKGYNILFVDLNNPTRSPYGYDPLLQCNSLTDVRNLAHTIAYSETSKTDPPREPFWLQNAENMTYIILRYVYEGYYSKGCTMKEALYLLDCLYYSDDRDLKEPPPTMKIFREGVFKFRDGTKENHILDDERAMKKEYPLHYEMRKWYKYNKEIYRMWRRFLTLGDVTGGSVASSTMNPVNSMFTDEIRSLFNGKLPQFDARELLKPKTVVFIYVSPVNTAQHRFCSIMYQQLFKRLFELGEGGSDGALPYPVQVLCDDFATGCKVQDFHELISIFREKGISATMLVQSETQLSAMYGKENATTIVNNCDTYIYLGGMDVDTATKVSKRLNCPMNDVLNMPIGQEYFFRRGQKPVVTKRYDVMKDMKLHRQEIRTC